MAVIYLQHPLHGAKVATLDIEADYDVQNGWKRYNPATLTPSEDAVPEVVVGNALRARRRPRRMEDTEGA